MSEENTVPDEGAEQPSMSVEEELGAIFDKANAEESAPPRDEHGRFAAKEKPTEHARDTEAQTAPEGAAPDTADQRDEGEGEPETVLDPPASWSATAKANWPNLPRELQDEVLRREGDWQKADGERVSKLKGYEPIEAALEPVRQHLQLSGIEPGQYVSQLVAADRALSNPQTQAQAIQWIARQYGIDLGQIAQTEPAESNVDPAIAPFVREINDLKSQMSSFVRSQQEQESRKAAAEIEAFAKDHPHFEEVRQQMGALIRAGAAADMAAAYDMAVWANPTTRAAMQAEKSAEAERKRKEEAEGKAGKARRIAQTNLSTKGSAGGATPPHYKDREEELGAIYDQVAGA